MRRASSTDSAILIEQEIRVRYSKLEEIPDKNDPLKKSTSQLVTTESPATVIFEIKPYVTHPTFHTKIYDKEQRIGYFINFATQKQIDEPVPQMAYWDIDPSLLPIAVRINDQAPQAVLQAMNEGILYWNRVAGKEILKIGPAFKSGEMQVDRSIHIFWIPWDSAGFARAGVQADPITGEILRAQVFMTSSWYKMTKGAFQVALGTEKPTTPTALASCVLDQNQMLDEKRLLNPGNPNVEKAVFDTIRIVLAHEMGHALGLRHNFAGSSTSSLADSDYLNNHERYLSGHSEKIIPTSTTVMDYTQGLDTAINGAAILNSALPYDEAAIGWGYLNKTIEIGKYKYCSDEHIMLARSQQKTVYGCDRFDSHKNALLGQVDKFMEDQKNSTITTFMNFISLAQASRSNYSKAITADDLLWLINFSLENQTYALNQYLYSDPDTTILTIPSVIDGFLKSLAGNISLPNSDVTPLLTSDANAFGGFGGIADRLFSLEQVAGGKFYENQVEKFFAQLDPSVTENIFSQQDLETIKTKMLEKAKLADTQFYLSVTKALAFSRQYYSIDHVTK